MRAAGRKSDIPGSKIPKHSDNQNGQNRPDAKRAMRINLKVRWKESHNLEGHACACSEYEQHPHKIDKTRPNYGMGWFHRAGVNHSGYGIRGVVKTIHKLKAKCNYKTNNKNNERRNFHQINSVLCIDSLRPAFCTYVKRKLKC